MDEEQFKNKKQWAGKAIPSMKRRRVGHDYQGRCIYMITLAVEGRRPLLGQVCRNDKSVEMHPSDLGHAVLMELNTISVHFPQIKIICQQLMPDHLHFILFVQEPLPCHLSRVISGFKGGCNRMYRQLLLHDATHGSSLWEQGFNDRILAGKGQLKRMIDYLADNPRRLAIKRMHPNYFQVQRDVHAGGHTFAALGNIFLLDAPELLQVQCTRKLSQEQIASTCRHFLEQARNGAVLVSPSISPGEKAVMKAAFEQGYPIIILQENGFAPLAKPGGRRFDACAQGQLLLLAPWDHHNERLTIQRQQCLSLNDMAAAICNRP